MINSGDTAFVLISAALVCLMTPGLAFFYGGLVRKKNVLTIMMQSFISMGVVTAIWFVGGFSLAFGHDVHGIIGTMQYAFLNGVGMDPSSTYGTTIPFITFFTYQQMFAIITPALITGAFADRVSFKSYLIFLVLWSLLVYIPFAHWIWGGGFLQKLGVVDFAGGMFFIVQVPVFLLLILSIVSLVSGSLLQEVQDEENKFNSIFNFAPYGALITRCEDSRVVEANKEALKLLEFDPQEFVGHTLIELDVWLDSELRTNLINDLKSGSVINGREISFQSKSKKIVPVLFSATLLTIGDTEYVVSTIKDISDINRLKSELEEMASHDMLTKLSNRRKFAEVSIMQLAIAARNNTKLAMVIFDIDDFKRINDDYSHEMGDQVLIGISERLLSFSRSADLVARYGGDEFTLLLTGISNREEAEAALQRLRLVFEPPICVMGYDFYIHISIGVATYPENGSGYEELIAKADKALYVAKRKGKNNIWFASE